MNRRLLFIMGFGLLFLLFVQSIATFIESIYILELLSTSLDEKVLGVVLLFSPVLLLPFGKRVPQWLIWVTFLFLFVGRGTAPYLDTVGRMLASGVATGAALILIPITLVTYPKPTRGYSWMIPTQGLALAVGLSVLLRTLNYTIDISLIASTGWLGWILGILLGLLLTQFTWEVEPETPQSTSGVTSAGVGAVAVLTIFHFMLSSPGVIARWTEGNYQIIVITVSLLSLLWLFLSLYQPDWFGNISPLVLTSWNVLFTISVTWTILAHTVSFPAALNSPPVIVSNPMWHQQIPLFLTLITFPVIFIDFGILAGFITRMHPTPRKMAPGFLVGVGLMVLLIFMNIFSNTWGYVEPISPFFRNKFWLSFLLITGLVTILASILIRRIRLLTEEREEQPGMVIPVLFLGVIFVATCISALLTDRYFVPALSKDTLKVMTYNIQQANDVNGEKSFVQQLALMIEVDPDIIGLQESDSARISLANNDYVRYFANKLGYHAYYGPKTVTGTYGTAILSRYPLENPRSIFTYSDQDEIGTAEVDILVNGRQLTVFNVHPDGSDEAKMVFARTLVERAGERPDVIAIGDYNLRGWEEAYLVIDAVYKNAWIDVYPSGIDDSGLDMSGRNRIDHILVSPHLSVTDPVYLLPPESWSDHPAHWAEISW